MFQLPVCPYCHTVYRYGQVQKSKKEEIKECYHCHKKFRVSKMPGIAVLWLIVVIGTVLLNLAFLLVMPVLNIVPIIIISFAAVVFGIIFVPFFIGYKPVESNKKDKID